MAISMDAEGHQDVQAIRRRAKHSKTRNGCVQCKLRHIKCDEERPACNRCLQAGLPCPGYDHDTTRSKRGPVRRFRIVQGANPVLAPAVKEESPITDPSSRGASLPTPIREEAAIDFFVSRTIAMLAKFVPYTQLWTQTTFEPLLTDAKIRNVAIAIGLTHQDMLDNMSMGSGPFTSAVQAERSGTTSPPTTMDPDCYYNAALAFMRTDISTIKEGHCANRTDVAAACLLIVIYLSLHDRMEEAAVHMFCGLEVVSEGGQEFIGASRANQELYLLLFHFAIASWPTHPSAPLFDVMQATTALSCLLTSLDPLLALRMDIDLVAQRIFVFTHYVTRGTFPDAKSTAAAREVLVEDLDRLEARVDAYATSARDDIGPTNLLHDVFVNTMHARIKSYRIFAQCVATRYQTTYDRHTKIFDKIVDLLSQAIQVGNALGGPDWPLCSIYLHILSTCRLISLLCRHPSLRRRSLELFKSAPQREGVIDAGEGYQLGKIMIEFEENGLDIDLNDKFMTVIPEENRLHFIESIRRAQLLDVMLADDEIMVRLMYRPDGESSYIERRVRRKKECLRNREQQGISARQTLSLTL